MAVVAKVDTPLSTYGDNAQICTWTALLQSTSDTGAPFECPGASDRSVQLGGTLGTGGAATIEGSNDGTNYATLTDPQGVDIVLTALGQLAQVSEITRWIRPRITAGDGSTSLTVTLLAKR